MSERRVVVTGLGALCCLGEGMDLVWRRLLKGDIGYGLITKFDTEGYSSKVAGEVKDFDVGKYLGPKESKKTDTFIQYAIASAQMAMDDAGLTGESVNSERFGVNIGSGIGGINEICEQQVVLNEKGPKRVSPFFIPNAIANLASGHVSMRFNAKGPNSSVCTACATGTHAIGDAYEYIKRGIADVMIAGGAEASVMPLAVAGFCSMRALSCRNDEPQRASRPFDLGRDGFVISEGSACVILEEESQARKRGARIYCELLGYGMSGDAFHLSHPAPEGEGAARAMRSALERARLNPDRIQYINAHGTSTPLNDKYESIAIRNVFGPHIDSVVINSTKSMVGHLLGAAGALELAVVARSIADNRIHGTMNYDEPDPDCLLKDVAANESRDLKIQFAISNSFGFGGTNACLAAGRYSG
ncbi:beta-ketoacyl-ACP synthase II [bacterium]|nr:beta-ketoacyl-ACP synthase II [candidate division CSSED10-310 bacterium]